jgi:hypothetical protein
MSRRPVRRLIISHAREEAFVPLTRVIFAKMGYLVVPEEEWGSLPSSLADRQPDLRIVDERRFGELKDDADDPVPIIVLTGRHGVTGADPRVVGAVRRPAGLHELYRVIQQAVEDVPRASPRVPTYLPARCRDGEREWRGAVLSLSENGCLLRSPEPLDLGRQIQISFELPRVGVVETQAETAYQILPDLGLIFHSTPAGQRTAIADFIERSLAVL